MFKPDFQRLRSVYASKRYPFKTGIWELNVFGIRQAQDTPNTFDDTIGVVFTNAYRQSEVHCFPATTEPGSYYLKYPLKKDGCLILLEGHYPDVYKIGQHRGYKALEQCGTMHYVRDNNRNALPEINASDIISGNFKTNIHHAAIPELSTRVDKWSAGCQVINQGWYDFLNLFAESYLITGRNLYSFSLFNSRDVA